MWTIYNSITELPEGIWDRYISNGDVCLDERLICTAESISLSKFRYFLGYDNDQIVAVFMAQLCDDYAITGTDETSGNHFWYDVKYFSQDDFFEVATAQVTLCCSNIKRVIFRDFFENPMVKDGCVTEGLDVSTLKIDDSSITLDKHISTLKYKYRYQINQYRNALSDSRYTTETVVDFVPILDQLYPLYVDVCNRSTEYPAPAYSEEYFLEIKRNFGADAVTVLVRDSGEIIGFMLLLYTATSCVHQYIGFDRIDNLYLWHNLTLASISDAIKRDVHNINMGVTNSVAKHKFGAKTSASYQLSIDKQPYTI